MLTDCCKKHNHTLIWVDSEEMLAHLPDADFIRKIAGYYPYCDSLFEEYIEKIDMMLVYSVLHYIFTESNIWDFLDRSLELLAHGGTLLIGDIPNISKRKRFFSSQAGIDFHRNFTGTSETPSSGTQPTPCF